MRGCLSLVCFMFGACEALHSMIDIFRSKYHYYITLRYIITICSITRHYQISTYLVLVTTTVTIIAILQCTARPALAVAKVASSRPVSRLITACFRLDIIKCAITPELWVRLVATSRVVGPSVAGCDLVHDLVEGSLGAGAGDDDGIIGAFSRELLRPGGIGDMMSSGYERKDHDDDSLEEKERPRHRWGKCELMCRSAATSVGAIKKTRSIRWYQ